MTTTSANTPAPDGGTLGFIARPTPQLRAAMDRFQGTLPPAEFADLLSQIRDAIGKFTDRLLGLSPGIGRAAGLHAMMDDELKAAAHLPVSCRKGCAGCCHYEVEITQDEAELLKQLVQNGLPIARDRLEEQAARERKSAEWGRFFNPENRCVLLGENGECRVYADRPAICRKLLVTTPAEACTTPGDSVSPVQVLMAEILLSAALSIDGVTFSSLPKMLHAALHPACSREAPATSEPARGGH